MLSFKTSNPRLTTENLSPPPCHQIIYKLESKYKFDLPETKITKKFNTRIKLESSENEK